MPAISVLTPTARQEGLALVAKALRRQTFKDFQWLISVPTPLIAAAPFAVFDADQWRGKHESRLPGVSMYDPHKEGGDVWSLNKAYNKMIRRAEGELIVSWQDFTYAKADALEKFWTHYQLDHKKIVSGVGNKYADDTWKEVTWADPRKRSDQGTFYPCYPNDVEFNFAALPRAAFYAAGGFDEELDKFYGMDGFSITDRLNLLNDGWDFYLDQTNESYSLAHGRPDKWEELNAIHGPYAIRRKAYLETPKLTYL